MRKLGIKRAGERGAAAVEFAIVSMLLVTLLLGIVEFGWAFFVQGTIAGSAREAVREYAIHKNPTAAESAAVNAGTAVGVTGGMVAITATCPATPPAGTSPAATATVTYPYAGLTGFFPAMTLTGRGTMRCNG